MAVGFRDFMATSEALQVCAAAVERERLLDQVMAADSHPPLSHRLEHAARLAIRPRSRDDRLAIELVADVRTMELALATQWVKGKPVRAVPRFERLG